MQITETRSAMNTLPLSNNRKNLLQSDNFWGILFILPFMVGITIFLLIPLVSCIFLSFTSYNVVDAPTFIGIRNYVGLIAKDNTFRQTFINTLVFTAGIVPSNVIFALIIAILLNSATRLSAFFRGLYFIPVITSEVVFSVVWLWIWNNDYGLLNYVLSLIGVQGPNWLGEPGWAMFSVITTRLLKNLGINVVIILAALQSIPDMYYEAADLDGANKFRKFIHVTIPELGPIIFLTVMITIIGAFKVFGTILILTNGGPAGATNVLIMYLYQLGFRLFEYGKASAVGVIIFAIVLAMTLIQWLMRKKMVYQEG